MTWTRLRVSFMITLIFTAVTMVGCDDDVEVVYYEAVPTHTTYIIDDCDCECWFCW